MKHALKLGKYVGLPKLYLKIEGANPTGSYKDRATRKIIEDAQKIGARGVTAATCGNFGFSITTFCNKLGLLCNIFIPRRYNSPKVKMIVNLGAQVTYTKGCYKEAVNASNKYANSSGYYNANVSSNRSVKLAIKGYSAISNEIVSALGTENIGSVWSAVGNGTGIAGIYKGFLKMSNKVSIPRFGAVSSKNNNPIIKSFKIGKPIELDPKFLKESYINEPLVNYRSYQIKETLKALSLSGMAYGATDKEMLTACRLINNFENLMTTPASACVLSGLLANRSFLDPKKFHILVLTS